MHIIDSDHATALMTLASTIGDAADALQYYTAMKLGLAYFISADIKMKKAAIPQLQVYTTAGLLAELAAPWWYCITNF